MLFIGRRHKNISAKHILLLFVFAIVLFSFGLTSMILNKNGMVNFAYHGFGVDSSGIIYVGTESGIVKYKDYENSGILAPEITKSQNFLLLNDDTVLVYSNNYYHVLDLNGNEIKAINEESLNKKLYYEFNKMHMTFIGNNGLTYHVGLPFLRTTLYDENDNVVFQMPIGDYLYRLSFIVIIIGGLVFAVWFLVSINKKK